MSALPRTVSAMTMKRSEFGSLTDRLGRAPRRLDDLRVRHVWLDSSVAALVVDRRKTAGRWEGLVVRAEDGELLGLADAGIDEILLNYRDVDQKAAGGNRITQIASYLRNDGSKGQVADALLNYIA